MKRFFGGEKVPEGMYIGLKSGEFFESRNETNILPGSRADKFVKVRRWMPLLLGPAFGLFFVIFLPLSGIAGLLAFLVHKAKLTHFLHPTRHRRIATAK